MLDAQLPCASNGKACLSVVAVGDDIKHRGEHVDNEGDDAIGDHVDNEGDAIGEYVSRNGLGMLSGEHQSATHFGVSTNSPGENWSHATIRANHAGEHADLAGVSLGLLDVSLNLAGDDNGAAEEVVRAESGKSFPCANIK